MPNITEKDVIKKIQEITAKQLIKYPHEVEMTYDFKYDLGAESIDMYFITDKICAAYDISYHILSYDILFADNAPKTVDDMVTLVCNKLGLERSTNKNSSKGIKLTVPQIAR